MSFSLQKAFNVRKELQKLKQLIKRCKIEVFSESLNKELSTNFNILYFNYSVKAKENSIIKNSSLLLCLFIKIHKQLIKLSLNELTKFKVFNKSFKIDDKNRSALTSIYNNIIDSTYKFCITFNNVLDGSISMEQLEKYVVSCMPEEERPFFKNLTKTTELLNSIDKGNLTDKEKIKTLIDELNTINAEHKPEEIKLENKEDNLNDGNKET